MSSRAENNWIKAWKSPTQRAQLLLGSVPLFILLGFLPIFFNHIEKRNGVTLADPILAAIPAHNVSIPIFTIIWGMGVFILIRAIKRPSIYIQYSWALLFVTLVRLVTITLVPLNPPVGIIIISDPLTNLFYGQHVVTKDLFFSGHTALLVLIALCLEKKRDRIIAAVATVAVGVLLLVQHIHYTLDVVAAPVFAYLLYRLSRWVLKKVRYPVTQPGKVLNL